MDNNRISVLVGGDIAAPDHPSIDVIGTAPTGNETVAQVLTELPDTLLLDVSIGEPDARAVCRRIREWAPVTKVLVVSELDDQALYSTLVAGAAGAVLAGQPSDHWAAALATITNGGSALASRAAFRILHDIDAWAEKSADPLYPPPTLTATEREVLVGLAAGRSTATIAASHAVTPHLVEQHAGYAVAKLHRYVLGAETLGTPEQDGVAKPR